MWPFRRRKRVPVTVVPLQEDRPLYRATIIDDNSIRGLVEHLKFFQSLGCFEGKNFEVVIRIKKPSDKKERRK